MKITLMSRFLYSLTFVALCLPVFGQGIEFFHGEWDEALAESAKTEKLIFVDAYAEWCGPCKRMAATTFVDPEVGDFFNDNFINVKIDIEKGYGPTFNQKYHVTAFPTLLFINDKGEVIHRSTGAKQVKAIIEFAKKAILKDDRTKEYEVAYNEGKRDYKLVYSYVKALNRIGRPSAKIVNDYLRSKPKITDDQMTSFLVASVTVADSKAFEELIKRKSKAEKIAGKDIVKNKIINACKKSVDRAIEYESEMLLTEAQNKMKSNYKSESKSFEYESKMIYYQGLGYTDMYLETAEDYCKKVIKKDAEAIHGVAEEISRNHNRNKKALTIAEDLAKKASKQGNNADHYFTYAKILNLNEKKEDAIIAANKALQILKENNAPTQSIEGFISYLQRES